MHSISVGDHCFSMRYCINSILVVFLPILIRRCIIDLTEIVLRDCGALAEQNK